MIRNTATRLTLDDTVQEALFKVSDGNPGGLTVCMRLMTETKSIDPDDVMGGFGSVLTFDDKGIYGSHIWLLFKDICKQNLSHMIAVLRANQLGFLSDDDLKRSQE